MFLLLCVSSSLISTSSTSSSPSLEKLFLNTIKKWNINIQSPSDRRERWNRFTDFKVRVDRLTPGHNLQSLNGFSVTNDAEYASLRLEEAIRNETFYESSMYTESNNRPMKKRKKRALAESNTFWLDLGLPTPTDQISCGACWSFPTVGAIEGVYKFTTGEEITLSQQYLVDCTFTYSGCAGGDSSDGYKILRHRQYMPLLSSYPYKGYWSKKCKSDGKIATFQDNGMTKMWFQDFYKLPATESGYLGGLTDSPVPFGMYISNNFLSYSGGVVEDSTCVQDHKGHAMLLVGYTTNEITVKASYGTSWGEKGYARFKRGSSYLSQCNMYKTAYTIELTVRRDIEYKVVIGSPDDMRNIAKSRKNCKSFDTETVTGWDLAVIPTAYHNDIVVKALQAVSPNVESDEKANYAWIGFRDMDLDGIYLWVDGTPVDYYNNTLKATDKFGMINKNTGKWSTKGSTTYSTYSVCSRYKTCWDISTAIGNGTVSFSKSTRVEGTTASITCNTGATLDGTATLTCAKGVWGTLPTCTYGSDVTVCPSIAVASATISPVQPVVSGVKITITCSSGYTIKGDSVLTCSGETFDKSAPTCEKGATTCNKPTIANGAVNPTTATIADGEFYTGSCSTGYTLSGTAKITCTGGSLSTLPTCTSGATTCNKPTIANGAVNPTTATIANGEFYTGSCNTGYTLSGTAKITCTGGSLSTLPTCTSGSTICSKPKITDGTVSPTTATIASGAKYTVSCNSHFTINGTAEMTCTKGTLSTAPICSADQCNKTELTVTNGKITSGTKEEYNFKDKVVWTCNDNYELIGNKKVMCVGDTWSSTMPTCEAINTKCDEYKVKNGKLKNKFPYITGDLAQVVCKSTYMVTGTNPNTCIEAGWKNDKQTCEENDGTYCRSLVAPKNGNLNCDKTKYTAGTKCTVSCKSTYVSLSTLKETTCSSKFIWAHATSTNSLAEFAPCILMKKPKARKLKNQVTMISDYCRTASEKSKVEAALLTLLKDTLSINCLVNNKCSIISYSCNNVNSAKIKIKFTLSQTQDLIDTTLLKEAKTLIKNSVSGDTFTLSIVSKRRRATTTLSADPTSLVSSTAVTCESNEVLESVSGNCVKCPAGYMTSNEACVACPINTYNAAEGAISCQDCTTGTMTYGEGSTSSDECVSLCTVPTIADGSLNYFSGSNVDSDTNLILTCNQGYETTTTNWQCDGTTAQKCTKKPSNTKCTKFDAINSVLSQEYPYSTGDTVTITCNYQYKINKATMAYIKCETDKWNDTTTVCKKQSTGLSNTGTIIIVVVIVVIILFVVFIASALFYKKNQIKNKNRVQVVVENPVKNTAI